MERGERLDGMEGDIMTFSELDLAQLGLMPPDNEALHFPPHHDSSRAPLEPLNLPDSSAYSNDLSFFQPTPLSAFSYPAPPNHEKSHPPGLPRRRSRYLRSQMVLQSSPIDIPAPSGSNDSALDPMQRWQESPPETEAASLSDIVGALKDLPLRSQSSAGSLRSRRVGSRAASTVSFGSGTSRSSGSVASTRSAGRNVATKDGSKGRVKKGNARNDPTKPQKVFSCTFCCDSFKTKYDWARHEKSLHLNLGGWVCTPHGGTIVSSDTGRRHCAYCNMLDPTPEHLSNHNHETCHSQGGNQVFSRKDHLVQHLRLVHHVTTQPLIDGWKVEPPPVRSRCGFCQIYMKTWQERVDHLAMHFRKGAKMDNWKGEHCFEPCIAARVENAISPYLIGPESRALVPFSATDPGTKDHLAQIQRSTEESIDMWRVGDPTSTTKVEMTFEPHESESPESAPKDPDLTFPEVLALHLGRYAREQMRQGTVPTDEMFQAEARRLMFDSKDPWDQTIADNEDWLADFRSRHLAGESRDLGR